MKCVAALSVLSTCADLALFSSSVRIARDAIAVFTYGPRRRILCCFSGDEERSRADRASFSLDSVGACGDTSGRLDMLDLYATRSCFLRPPGTPPRRKFGRVLCSRFGMAGHASLQRCPQARHRGFLKLGVEKSSGEAALPLHPAERLEGHHRRRLPVGSSTLPQKRPAFMPPRLFTAASLLGASLCDALSDFSFASTPCICDLQ